MSRGIESMILGGLLGSALKEAGERPKVNRRPAAQDVATLQAAAARYAEPAPFAVGDLVTPRADSPLKNVGRPHIVLEVEDRPQSFRVPVVHGNINHSDFGARLDVRVASVCDCDHGEVTAHWGESWMFEPYAAPSEASEPAAA